MRKKLIAALLVLAILLASSYSAASFAQPSLGAPRNTKSPLNSFTISFGEIGVYGNRVFIEMPAALPAIHIGNQTYVALSRAPHIFPVSASFLNSPARSIPFNFSKCLVIGEVNSPFAVSYVLSHIGQKIAIFPPSNQTAFELVVMDMGNYSSQPVGMYTVQYVQHSTAPAPVPQPKPIPVFSTTKTSSGTNHLENFTTQDTAYIFSTYKEHVRSLRFQ